MDLMHDVVRIGNEELLLCEGEATTRVPSCVPTFLLICCVEITLINNEPDHERSLPCAGKTRLIVKNVVKPMPKQTTVERTGVMHI